MCGACGTGLAVPPWEVAAHGGSLRDVRARARAAERLCAGKVRIRPYGPAGYQVTERTGRVSLHPGLDALLDELAARHPATIRQSLAESGEDPEGVVESLLRSRLRPQS